MHIYQLGDINLISIHTPHAGSDRISTRHLQH